VGVTRQTIATIEKAKYYPTLELAFLIARVFDKEISEVFQFEFKIERFLFPFCLMLSLIFQI